MSLPPKQTKLDLSRFKKRPAPDNAPDGGRFLRLTPPSSSGLSSPPSSSTPSQVDTPQTDQPPSSGGALSGSNLESQSDPQTLERLSLPAPNDEPEKSFTPLAPQVPPMRLASLSFTNSQFPLSSSSQRIVRNGERMVTNSDEDDDDSSSLEDLDELLRREQTQKHDPDVVDEAQAAEVCTSRCMPGRVQTAQVVPPAPTGPIYKYSLAALVEQRKQLQATQEGVDKVNAILEARRQYQSINTQSPLSGLPNENVLDAVMNDKGNEEEVGRLKDALRRTEALHHDNTWSFFRADVENEIAAPPDFPRLHDDQLQPLLQNSSSRQQAFLNSCIEDFAAKRDLPDELLMWVMESACSEKREDLRLSYIHVLKELGLRNGNLLPPIRINEMFQRLGASDDALNMQNPVMPRNSAWGNVENIIRDRLPALLGLFQLLSGTLRPDSNIHAICIVCRLLLDHQVVRSCSVMTAIEETLYSLIESIPAASYEQELHRALVKVHGSVSDPTLRLQLVQNLPVLDVRTAAFRRRLALAFFFREESYLDKPADEPMMDLALVAAYLETPRFAISKKTDYAELTASIVMLDIGIDAGDPFLPPTTNKAEKKFDAAVDLLSKRLKDLSTQIVGTSALNMRRTEAKEALDAIQRRLTYAVRSRPPPKKSILVDDIAAGHEAERQVMSEWMHSAGKQNELGMPLAELTNTKNNISA